MTALKMTAKRAFCLAHLAEKEDTGRAISAAAISKGQNTTKYGSSEWADGTLRWLRENDLVEHTGAEVHAAKVYRITEKGRAALDAAKEEA